MSGHDTALRNAYAKGRRDGFGYNSPSRKENNPYSRKDYRDAWERGRLDELAKLAAADAKTHAEHDPKHVTPEDGTDAG